MLNCGLMIGIRFTINGRPSLWRIQLIWTTETCGLLPAVCTEARKTQHHVRAPCLAQVKRAMQLPKLSAPPTDFIKSMEQYITEAPRPAEGEAHKVRGWLVPTWVVFLGLVVIMPKAGTAVHRMLTVEKLQLFPPLMFLITL